MPKYKKSAAELEVEFREQVVALRSSLQNYDSGALWEAKRIAASIYIFCFDGTGRTKSLLGLVGLKQKIQFISTYVYGDFPDIELQMVIPPTPLFEDIRQRWHNKVCPSL